MASGKTNYLKDLYIVHKTEISVNPSLGSNSGRGYSITVTPPTGYSIVSHIHCYHQGAAGMNLTFDYVNQTSTSCSVYLWNSSNASCYWNIDLVVFTLCKRNDIVC